MPKDFAIVLQIVKARKSVQQIGDLRIYFLLLCGEASPIILWKAVSLRTEKIL